MLRKDAIFTFFSLLRHRLGSRHTMGHGIHSPYLFYIARAILPDSTSYYCFEPIESERRRLMTSSETVYVDDLGTGSSESRPVAYVARTSLMPPHEAQLMMRLAVLIKAQEILELGTSLGITTAYLASACKASHVVTVEGAPELRKLAMQVWKRLKLRSIESRLGDIDAVLDGYKPERPVDLVLMDANHTGEATLRYFNRLQPFVSEKTILVMDDIRYSRDMYRAWLSICEHPSVTAAMDLGALGLVFFDTHFEKRIYKIRL